MFGRVHGRIGEGLAATLLISVAGKGRPSPLITRLPAVIRPCTFVFYLFLFSGLLVGLRQAKQL
jgi:hypothetical protein